MKMGEEVEFCDILEPRNTHCGIFSFMTRAWNPQKSYILDRSYTCQDLKDLVANSVYIDSVIEAECARTGASKEKLKKEVQGYLDEMALDKKIHTTRWMGIFFLKICFLMRIRVFVNEPNVLKLKSSMGKNPVLFLPTHRSYADFCLLSYLCYHYDIELPAVAAGMDFYSMAVVGRGLRETSAFYIRRSLAGAPLYAATLKQYVRVLVAKYCSPVEFFLEGTRSRSNKSLPPKYGMLSMMLMPFFAREVNDITIVPVNIAYDRVMEQSLFAYEHLGVPKPKESTGGLLKSLKSLNDHYGNIYINFSTPFSLKEYIQNDYNITDETKKPIELQQLTPEQFTKVQEIANYAITLQQKNTVVTISNLISIVLMQSIVKNELLHFDEVLSEIGWVIMILKNLGASVYEKDIKSSVERILVVHSKMISLDAERRLRLLSGTLMDVSSDVKAKMKGHILKAETMVNAVPIIQLQLYVNAVLHYFIPPAVVCLLVQKSPMNREKLAADYNQVRKLLKHEFFFVEGNEDFTFSNAVEYCVHNKVISRKGDLYTIGDDPKLQFLLKWSIMPALTTILICMEVLTEINTCEHKKALKLAQERIETRRVHPYCLSLESIANCLQGMILDGCLIKDKTDNNEICYRVVPEKMQQSHQLIKSILPSIVVDFSRGNNVILDFRTVLSRL